MESKSIRYRELIIQNTLIILFGVVIFYLDHLEFGDTYNKTLLVIFSLIKTGFFILTGFRKILIFSKSDLSYHNFLLFIGLSILLVMISFAVDYICLFQLDPTSFSGLRANLAWYEIAFEFLYFSVLIFGNLGIATVIPTTIPAEFIMMTEAILSFITIILILSDFISLKESLAKSSRSKSN